MIGHDYRHLDAVERVVGTLPFVLDKEVPGMVHAKTVRSHFPHARIISIDTADALASDGVLAVITGADLETNPAVVKTHFGAQREDQPILAIDNVRYTGDPVALVVAESPNQAAAAAELIYVDYEELPYATAIADAKADGAALVHEEYDGNVCGVGKLRHGDIEVGFQEADFVVEQTYTTPSGSHVPFELFVSIAEWRDDALEIWSSAQAPHNVRKTLAGIFGMEETAVRVQVLNLGGGYGGKGQTKIEPLAAVAARIVGRPVKLVLSREEVFFTIGKHAAVIRLQTGVKNDGRLVARKVTVDWNAGAYAVASVRAVIQGMARASGPYRIPHVWVDSTAYYTNTVPTGPFRGAMTTQVAWAYESQMDHIAERLGLDPLEVRRRNLLVEGDTDSTGGTMHDVHFIELLDEAAAGIEWGVASEDPGPGKARGKGLGIIMKSTITPSRSEARLVLDDGGELTVYSSSVEMGQGSPDLDPNRGPGARTRSGRNPPGSSRYR